ncbi:MAG: AAA family ATPase [Prevotella sp.]|nr:AAA family ATPase [Prevotella sp.]
MERRYPVGIQTFERIIDGGYVYVDKTDLVWRLQNVSPFVFLSRPRRFGKSLLSSTLHSFFEGRKDLFKGLKIMELEKEWDAYPVIHLDMSTTKGQASPEKLEEQLFRLLLPYDSLYGTGKYENTPGARLAGIIQRASQQTGKKVVVIIDEYDSPMLDVLHDVCLSKEYQRIIQELYQPLKASDPIIRFCFLTGITKLSHMNIFSTLNNLINISMSPEFATICGFTDADLRGYLSEGINSLAHEERCSVENMYDILKAKYDGYHFSHRDAGVYNPYSILNAFTLKIIGNYWFESGTPTFLIKQMQQVHTDITALDGIEAPDTAFSRPTESMNDIVPLLYQSGYLTIKDYHREDNIYTLGFPNTEVRIGYADGLLPSYVGIDGGGVQTGFALKFWRALKKDDIELALTEMKAYFAGLPYIEGFKKKLQEVATVEGFYEYTMYLIFSMLNVYVRTQVKCSGGRADMVVHMPNTTYVLELKINGTAQQALDQINSHGYAIPYQTEDKYVVKVGIRFSTESKNIEDWIVE